MSAIGEVENATLPMTEVADKEQSKLPVKEKKPKEMKPRSIKNVSHPPYFEMIKEALLALKEKGGSSPYAIGKYMEEKHKAALPENFRKILGLQLKKSASKGKLIKVKASYKLSESGRKDKATTKAPKTVAAKEKKPEQAKSVAAKSASKGKLAKKSDAVKKKKTKTKAKAPAAAAAALKAKAVQKTMKRAAPAKAKAKQPKSIKSSPAKKAKKAAA